MCVQIQRVPLIKLLPYVSWTWLNLLKLFEKSFYKQGRSSVIIVPILLIMNSTLICCLVVADRYLPKLVWPFKINTPKQYFPNPVGKLNSSYCFLQQVGEFLWEDVAPLQELGFSLHPSKGTIEPGQKHTVSITWTPNRAYKVGNRAVFITFTWRFKRKCCMCVRVLQPFEVVQTCVTVSLTGAQRSVYRVTLMALVSNAADWPLRYLNRCLPDIYSCKSLLSTSILKSQKYVEQICQFTQ